MLVLFQSIEWTFSLMTQIKSKSSQGRKPSAFMFLSPELGLAKQNSHKISHLIWDRTLNLVLDKFHNSQLSLFEKFFFVCCVCTCMEANLEVLFSRSLLLVLLRQYLSLGPEPGLIHEARPPGHQAPGHSLVSASPGWGNSTITSSLHGIRLGPSFSCCNLATDLSPQT